MRLGGQRHVPAAFPPEKTRQPLHRSLGPVWTGAENITSGGFRSPHRPALSESLHRLCYPGPLTEYVGY
jgi:hypothetical protein